MKLASWNINSIRVRLPQILAWLDRHSPDVLCLQETKVTDDDFPADAFTQAGYHVAYVGQKTYNGVATVTRAPAAAVVKALPGADDAQKRLLAITIENVRVVNVYVPNGEEVGSEKFAYKLSWLEALKRYVTGELKTNGNFVIVGDFNIAPEERDVHDPAAWEGHVLFSEKERAIFDRLLKTGLTDVFRKFDQPEKSFSWWDYRQAAFRRNRGLRIDHILCSRAMDANCVASTIDREPRKNERPSDHAPVVAEFS